GKCPSGSAAGRVADGGRRAGRGGGTARGGGGLALASRTCVAARRDGRARVRGDVVGGPGRTRSGGGSGRVAHPAGALLGGRLLGGRDQQLLASAHGG